MNNIPQNLLDYVSSQSKAGVAAETIRMQLGANNWKQEDIDQAFMAVQAGVWPGAEVQAVSAPAVSGILLQADTINTGTGGLTSSTSTDRLLAWMFRGGFAGIFLINGVIALVRPAEFQALLSTFPLAQAIGHINIMVFFVGINDLVLGSLILSGKAKKFVWAWAGVWLAMVTLIKLVSLF